MREIKFRAWTGFKMEYNVMVGFLGAFYVQGIDPKDTASMSPFNTHYDKLVPIMQFTGLKDKNGKEIYEGDIVKHDPHWSDERTQTEVEFLGARFTPFADGDWTIYPEDCEVIGNIYENPELLK